MIIVTRKVHRPNPIRLGVFTGRAVINNGIVRPAVPKAFGSRHELFGPCVAFGVANLLGIAEIAGRRCRPGRHDIPTDPAATHMINRCKLPCQVERLAIGRRCGCDQSDSLCRTGQRRQRRNRLKPVMRRPRNIRPKRQRIGEKH